jgi:hypothetical protein
VGNQVLCELCYSINPLCSVCVTATKCSSCNNGYYLTPDATCSSCSDVQPGCEFCVGNGTDFLCLTCNYPYEMINGDCWTNQTNLT